MAKDRFPSDEGTLFSEEGAKLYRLALAQASDSQQLDAPFLLRMIHRTQLDHLLQSRWTRVEIQVEMSKAFWLSLGLSLPSVLLAGLYLVFHIKWAIANRREKREIEKNRRARDQTRNLLVEYSRGKEADRPPKNGGD